MKLKNILTEVSATTDIVVVIVPDFSYFFKSIMDLKAYIISSLKKIGQGNPSDSQTIQNYPINSDQDLQEFAKTYLPRLQEFSQGAMAVLVPTAIPAGQPVKKPLQ